MFSKLLSPQNRSGQELLFIEQPCSLSFKLNSQKKLCEILYFSRGAFIVMP